MPKIVDHDQRRRELIAALWRIVARDGVHAVSVRAVAAEVGQSKSGVMHYFTSRGDLLRAALEDQMTSVQPGFDLLISQPLTEQLVVEAVLLGIPHDNLRRNQSQVWLLLVSESAADPGMQELLTRLNQQIRQSAKELLQRMRQQGLLSPECDIEVQAATLHALVDGLSLQHLSNPLITPWSQVEQVVQAHIAALCATDTQIA